MQLKHLPFAFMILGLSGSAVAQVTMDVPDSIEVIVANGSSPELEGSMFDANQTLTLQDGENQILFRYKPYFHQGNDRIIVESQPIIATFQAKDMELNFELPKYRNLNEAEENINSATWQLRDSNNQPVEAEYDQLIVEGMQIGRNYQKELVEYNRKGGAAAIYVEGMAMESPALTSPVDSNTAEEMLHFWYSKADAKTKARFKQFVQDH